MSATLTDVQRIAAEVARNEDRRLEVVGAIPAEGEPAYAEVVLTIRGCQAEPCFKLQTSISRRAIPGGATRRSRV